MELYQPFHQIISPQVAELQDGSSSSDSNTYDNSKQSQNRQVDGERHFEIKEIIDQEDNIAASSLQQYQIGRQPLKQQNQQQQQSCFERNNMKREMSIEVLGCPIEQPKLRQTVSSVQDQKEKKKFHQLSENKENVPDFGNGNREKKEMEVEEISEKSLFMRKKEPNYIFEKDKLEQNPVYQHVRAIFDYLLTCEERYQPTGKMLETQKDITEKMRAILIDWLVDIHWKFKLVPDTLYLTVNLIDRFIERKPVSREKLQLVGSAAMYIASKYEEIYPPELGDFVFSGDNSYTKQEILSMEGEIVDSIGFELAYSSPFRFLERYSSLNDSTQEQLSCAHYLIELSLVDYSMVKYSPSLQAASALYLINKLFEVQNPWKSELISQSNYKIPNLKCVVKEMWQLLTKANDLQQMYLKLLGEAESLEKQRMEELEKWYSSKIEEIEKIIKEDQNNISEGDDTQQEVIFNQQQKIQDTYKEYEETKKYIQEAVQKYKRSLSSSTSQNLVAIIRKFSNPHFHESAKLLFLKQQQINSLSFII